MKIALLVNRHSNETRHQLFVSDASQSDLDFLSNVFARELQHSDMEMSTDTHQQGVNAVLYTHDARKPRTKEFTQRLEDAASERHISLTIEPKYTDHRKAEQKRARDLNRGRLAMVRDRERRDRQLKKVENALSLFTPVDVPESVTTWEEVFNNCFLPASGIAYAVLKHEPIMSQELHSLSVVTTLAPLRPMGIYEYTGQGIETDTAMLTRVLDAAAKDAAPFLADDGRLNVFFVRHRCGAFLFEIWKVGGGWMYNLTDHQANVFYKKGTKVFLRR